MDEYRLSKPLLVNARHRLHGIFALLTGGKRNILPKAEAEIPPRIIATHKLIFVLRSLCLK